MAKSLRYLWLSSLSFAITVVVCTGLYSHSLLTHTGLSDFGNLGSTLLPYSVGLVATSYFLLRACRALGELATLAARSFRAGLEGIALALLGIVATPSGSTISFVQDLHGAFGFIIFVTQAALSLHYLIKARGDALDWLLLALQLVAICLVILSFHAVGVLRLMLPAQLLAIVAFGALLIRAVSYRAGQVEPVSSR